MEREDIYRNLKFIGITAAGGIALIYILFAFVSNPFRNADFRAPQISNKAELESNLESFNKKSVNFNPEDFPVLLTKITSSGNNGLIQKSTMNYLSEKLIENHSQIILNQCDKVLLKGLNYYALKQPLSDLERVIGKDEKIEYYRKQIYWLNYYTYTFMFQVDNYINKYPNDSDIQSYNNMDDRNIEAKIRYKNFLDQEFNDYEQSKNDVWINRAENTPLLESKYINPTLKKKLSSTKQLLKDLQDNYVRYIMLKRPDTYNNRYNW